MAKVLALVVLVLFLSLALYGALSSVGMIHEGGCLSAIAFGTPCLSGSLVDGHLKLFSMLGLILPILILFLFSALVQMLGPWLVPSFIFARRLSPPDQAPPPFHKLISWLSLREHSPTAY
ncbi:MAG TPA: hypothetical protein VJG48_00385 [Candidatus Paceibacterota bacterium]